MPNVIITARYFAIDPAPLELLQANGCTLASADRDWTRGDANLSEDEVVSLLDGVDGAIVSSMPITPAVLERCPALRAIVIRGAGFDSISLPAATRAGIPVVIAPGFTESVADYTLGLMLAVSRRIAVANDLVRDGRWEVLISSDICGKTLGIIGLGKIGKAVARRARGFGMTILAADQVRDPLFAEEFGVRYVELPELLGQSDIVSINAPLGETTNRLIDAAALGMMKRSAILVNTARGGLVDEAALAAALRAERLAGAGLDVFQQEPVRENRFAGLSNVVLSPHLAAYSREGLRSTGMLAARNLLTVLRGERPDQSFIVNPDVYRR
jgi:D-3-phosphoglycerate dehydrogenase